MAGMQKRELPLTRQLPYWSFSFIFSQNRHSVSCDITYFLLLRKLHTIPKTALHKNNVS